MNYGEILNIPKILHAHGVEHAVISPGSRNAPLTLALARNEDITCKVIPDERSASFIALGMAQQSNQAVVLVCTSGSATLNFAPAVAEAYYSKIPLLILTADRPPEWVNQRDGQTIKQTDVYGKHVLRSFNAPVELNTKDDVWHFQRILNEALILSTTKNGPVHINFPFREPLYPTNKVIEESDFKVILPTKVESNLPEDEKNRLSKSLTGYERKLIVCGQDQPSEEVIQLLQYIIENHKIPIVGDIIANIHTVKNAIVHADLFLSAQDKGLESSLKPDLLITIGKSILSKSLKRLLRQQNDIEHWHIEEVQDGVMDTYQTLTKSISTTPSEFLKVLANSKNTDSFSSQKQENYFQLWEIEERKSLRIIDDYFKKLSHNELALVHSVLSKANDCNLHLANSMSVRLANFIGLNSNHNVTVFCNRGTSGIDGSNSTALGHALTSDKLNVLITGDLAFFYDRNAFWNNYKRNNLRIVLLNNNGGSIFRMIPGPSDMPELEEYFETHQALDASHLCNEFGFEYLRCDKVSKVKNYVKRLFDESDIPILLELQTSSQHNKEVLNELKDAFRN